jgi:plasmid stabilization system protein ParE
VKVRITRRAEAHFKRRRAWWTENRFAAPALFDDEFDGVLRLIFEMPAAGVMWPTARNPRMRRVLMSETHHHIYFYVDEAKRTVVIVAVWGAPRGSGPKL